MRTTVPVVFLNGTADTAGPPANVAGATATMPNALLVSVPGTGHWTLDLLSTLTERRGGRRAVGPGSEDLVP